jgi:hypothetical protein
VIGAVLAEHPAVRVLSLTGSTATGSALMTAAAAGIKRLSLELGGNAPFVVLPDADLDVVADQLTRLKLLVSGQVCVTANRIFVHEAAEAALAERLAARVGAARLGDGLADGVEAGPLIHGQACAEVGTLVEQARAAGVNEVIIDPNLGIIHPATDDYAKVQLQNGVLWNLDRLRVLGCPILLYAARKPERLARILFASNVLYAGPDVIRTHHPDLINQLRQAETIETR